MAGNRNWLTIGIFACAAIFVFRLATTCFAILRIALSAIPLDVTAWLVDFFVSFRPPLSPIAAALLAALLARWLEKRSLAITPKRQKVLFIVLLVLALQPFYMKITSVPVPAEIDASQHAVGVNGEPAPAFGGSPKTTLPAEPAGELDSPADAVSQP